MANNALVVNTKIGNINVSFTPEYYKRAYNGWLNGDYKYLFALIDRAETDSFIGGCLNARHLGYKRKFTITPASDSAYDKEVAGFVEQTFARLSMRNLFEDVIDARMKEYVVISLIWEIINGSQSITGFKKLAQKFFRRDRKDNNRLKIDWGKELKEIPLDSALVVESTRKPIMILVLKDYIRKEFGEENWSSFLEIFGEAFIIGDYPAGADAALKAELEASVNSIAQSARGVKPKGTDITIIESKRSTGDQQSYLRDCKEGISLAILGHKDAAGSDKSMQIGDNSSGIEVKKGIAIDDMFFIEEALDALIKMLVDRNFIVTAYPKALLDKSDNIDAAMKLKAAELALNNGGQVDPVFFKEMGVPVLNEQPLQQSSILKDFGIA